MRVNFIIPARSGSERVSGKNMRRLGSQSLIEISINQAKRFNQSSQIIVTSDSEEYLNHARQRGATDCVLRPKSISGPESLDFEWLSHLASEGYLNEEAFVILRPTSPFRSDELIQKCISRMELDESLDSVRTLANVKEHPGKMWTLGPDDIALPYLKQNLHGPKTHALQYKSLPKVFIQTSVLEVARRRVVEIGSREGRVVGGVVTNGLDSLAIDTELDFFLHQVIFDKSPTVTEGNHEDFKF